MPSDLRDFLGGCAAVVGMLVHNGYWIGGLDGLLPNFEATPLPREIDALPAIAIGTDDGGNAFIITADGHVYRWTRETGDVVRVASPFAAFLARVADDWEAYVNDDGSHAFLV